MQNKHEAPLLVALKPSKKLKRLLVIIHLLALGSSLAAALPIAVKLALLSGICLHLAFTVKHCQSAQCDIKHTEISGWEIAEGNDFASIQILDSTVISVFAIFLHFKRGAERQTVLIMPDALSEDDYRRLIVRLKTASDKT
ncbi:MAG: protein YgfX [Methylobacter sp.]